MDNNYQNLTKKERRALRKQEKFAEQDRAKKKKNTNRMVMWGIAVIVLAGSVFGVVKLATQASSDDILAGLTVERASDIDQVKGNSTSSVTLIEYSDFECPACGSYYPILKQINEEFGDRIQFVYRHFPLSHIHRKAELAARAAEAAGRQDKFWEMHDKIFEGQSEWAGKGNADEIFIGYAESLNLDIEKFKSDWDLQEIKDKVNRDRQSGVRAGVNGTPSFFLNGERIQNPRGYEEFKNIIQARL